MLYADVASTSWPKSQEVKDMINMYLDTLGVTPGRSLSQQSKKVTELVEECRHEFIEQTKLKGHGTVIFNSGATYSLNECIKGTLKPGDNVITTHLEHNSVLRPINHLKDIGVSSQLIDVTDGEIDMSHLEFLLKNRKTKLLVVHSCSNTIGTFCNIDEIGKLAHLYGAMVLVDSSQSFGSQAIDLSKGNIDYLVFSGHKSLGGVSGIGGYFILDNGFSHSELIQGGTGVLSRLTTQPTGIPYKYESGTQNTIGILSLLASIRRLKKTGIENIQNQLQTLRINLIDELSQLKKVKLICKHKVGLPTILFTVEGYHPGEVSYILENKYNIITRPGLQCAPLAHKKFGTYPDGAVRVSLDTSHTMEDILKIKSALVKITEENYKDNTDN
ncbi:aminotransferase class V-fold PLP-dependent enzyme [Photorhabdus sp. P32]|uniref:aminotransferase class V-fold PLP-dependent enzyme n=1 Tax=Photorhabdus sp. P32 TaxID=3117549 RepID=UPI00311B2B51